MALDRHYWLWDLILLAMLALGLRLQGLGHLSFYSDEAQNALVARIYLQTGHFRLPSGRPEPNGLTYKWITAELFRWFGESEWIARFPSALCGLLVTVWIYLWGSHWFGPWTGRWAGLIYAVWPWSVTWGRVGRFYNLQQFLFFLIVTACWRMLENNSIDRPIIEPPIVGGKRASPIATVRRMFSLAALTLLSLATSVTTAVSLVFLPSYLLFRLVWSYRRGGLKDSEFVRTVRAVGASAVMLVAGVGFLYWYDPRVIGIAVESTRFPRVPAFYLEFFRNNFGLLFMAGLVSGSVMAVYSKGRQGWLVFSCVVGPLAVHSLLLPHYRPRFVYYVFPFVVLLSALPLGWSSERIETWFRRCLIVPKAPKNVQIVACLVVVLGTWSVVENVFVAERGTAEVVAGSPYTLAREVADWRGMAEWVSPYRERAKIVTTDAILCTYYLNRCDAVYPYLYGPEMKSHWHTGSPVFPDAESLLGKLNEWDETLILGTRRKFESTARSNPEGERLWKTLRAGSAEIWEGSLEVAFRWIKPKTSS